MPDHEPMIDDEIACALRGVVVAMRQDDPVPDLWRARVLREVGRARGAQRRRRGALVAAAALLCAVGGSTLLRTSRPERTDVESDGAPMAALARDVAAAPVRFTLDAPAAHRVALVGDFDAWAAEGRPMRRDADGRTWEVDVVLPPGRHAFLYLVDGVLRAAPGAARAGDDDFGVPSSVIVVAQRGN